MAIGIDRGNTAWLPRNATPGGTEGRPAFASLVAQRPDLGGVPRPGAKRRPPPAAAVDHAPVEVRRMIGGAPALFRNLRPAAGLAAFLEGVARLAGDIEIEPERQVVNVPPTDLLTRSLNDDRGTELPVFVKTPDVVVLVIVPEVVGCLEIEPEHDAPLVHVRALQPVGERPRCITFVIHVDERHRGGVDRRHAGVFTAAKP